MQVLGIDIGGSGIKGALVDQETGQIVSERLRIQTPGSFEIGAVSETIAQLTRHFNYQGPIGVGFPAAVADGVVLTPPTAHHVPGWVNKSINEQFSTAVGQPVCVLNDADAAGVAEMRFGAGVGIDGVVITVTLGTGVGGGLFMNGHLVPNLEIGKIYLRGQKKVAERYMASRIRKERGLSWQQYGRRVHKFCRHIEHVFSPSLIILGGGVSSKFDRFMDGKELKRSRLVPAKLQNQAGIVGAATWAAEHPE
jgi:polyphosphate glucokinase